MMAPPADKQEGPPPSPMESSTSDDRSEEHADERLSAINLMDELSFMKEGDAAILERGVSDSSAYPRGADERGADEGQASSPLKQQSAAESRAGEDSNLPTSSPATKRLVAETEAAEGSIDILQDHDSSTPRSSGARLYRRCLSGDVWPVDHNQDAAPLSPMSVSDHHLQSSSRAEQQHDHSSPDNKLRSSRSIERMMNEAAQFAEAVGELPPTDQSEVQLIIEDDGSDSDDETSPDIEIHVDKDEPLVRVDDEIMDNEPSSKDHVGETVEVLLRPSTPRSARTKQSSMDRRMNEAAQFAEAVGELPPTSGDDLQEIIESGGSEDDDDSIEAVIVKDGEISSIPESSQHAGELMPSEHESHKLKSRPRWPFKQPIETSSGFLHKLPDGVNTQDFEYKGICSNPPEITKRGIQRGNYAQLHRKAWLEVSDKYHRYGKNLRLYYRYWERLGFPCNSFFDWLDSKGEAAGQPLPNLDECPRSQLDSDTVLYVTNPDVTAGFILDIIPDQDGRGRVVDVDGDPVRTGPDGWIFVLRDNELHGAQKITSISGHSKQRFHHSSFFGGKAVAAAGILITDDDGYLYRQYPHSGHYRPGEADIQRMIFYLHHKGVDLRTFEFDTQQIFHVARGDSGTKADGQEKKRKIQSLHLVPAFEVACFLAHKARFIEKGIFSQIHQIRQADVTTVSEALDAVDDGGFWKRLRRDLLYKSSGAISTS